MKFVSSELILTETEFLQKSVAADLKISDPTGIIAKGKDIVNENPKKYDRGTSSVHDLPDLFTPCK
jgi:hypothetical protein